MLKKFLMIAGLTIGVALLLGTAGLYYFKPSEEVIVAFIKDNPKKAAITLVRNDTVLVNVNANRMMPLASTVKIIVAIAYAEQAAQGNINPDEMIALNALEQFYVPNTDGGAHPAWLASVQNKVQNGKISVREIAKGMIKYSSNANTEWLIDRLGIRAINHRLDSLGIKHHSPVYYLVSALFVGKEKFPHLKGIALEKALKETSLDDYISVANQVHRKLKTDTAYKNELGDLGMNIQRIWSDNLPSSTTAEYVGIMKKINSRTFFDPKAQRYLDEVMEYILENPANRAWLLHSGMKGGSTAFVPTKALYATDKQGNKTELAYLFNDLESLENTRLQMSMNAFELKILTDKAFREKLKQMLP